MLLELHVAIEPGSSRELHEQVNVALGRSLVAGNGSEQREEPETMALLEPDSVLAQYPEHLFPLHVRPPRYDPARRQPEKLPSVGSDTITPPRRPETWGLREA